MPWQLLQFFSNSTLPAAAFFASTANGYFGGSMLSRYCWMSLNAGSAASNSFGMVSGCIMNCMMLRTLRASVAPT